MEKDVFDNLFGDKRPEDKFTNMFGVEPVKQKANMADVFDSMLTDRQRQIKSVGFNGDLKLVESFIDDWDRQYQSRVDTNNDVSNQMLDLSQDINRQDEANSSYFKKIQEVAQNIKSKLEPKTEGFLFKKQVEQVVSSQELNKWIDDVQALVMSFKPHIDPFAKGNIHFIEGKANQLLLDLEAALTAISWAKQHNPSDIWLRREERVLKMKQMVQISLTSLKGLVSGVDARVEQLNDFTSVAVPAMILQLQRLVTKNGDNMSAVSSLDQIINLKGN